MAPLPASFTKRVWVDYEGLSGQHSLLVRYRPDVSDSQAQVNTIALANLLTNLWFDDVSVTGFRFAAQNSTVSIPFPPPAPIVGTLVGQQASAARPVFVSFIGRGLDGRRVRWYVWETSFLPDSDYRLPITGNTNLEAVRNFFADFGNGVTNINNQQLSVYNYVNTGYNAYVQRRLRRTG